MTVKFNVGDELKYNNATSSNTYIVVAVLSPPSASGADMVLRNKKNKYYFLDMSKAFTKVTPKFEKGKKYRQIGFPSGGIFEVVDTTEEHAIGWYHSDRGTKSGWSTFQSSRSLYIEME